MSFSIQWFTKRTQIDVMEGSNAKVIVCKNGKDKFLVLILPEYYKYTLKKGDKFMSGVTISALIKKMNLELLTKEINTDKIKLYHPDVNRPALQLAGYYEHFDRERVQLIGVVEYTYMQRMTEEQRMENYEKLLSPS